MPDSDETQTHASAEKAYAKASEDALSSDEAVKSKPVPQSKVPLKTKAATGQKTAAKKKAASSDGRADTAPRTTTATTISANANAANKDDAMTISDKVTDGFDSIMTDAQNKAKEAFEKSSALFGDYADFTRGNIDAVVQSGRILAEGLQNMGSSLAAESRSAFEAASADIKDMAAARSPTDLIQLQSEVVRKNFDSAVAYGSKNTEAMIKLASEIMAPISSRVSLAVEKVRQAAI